VQEKRRSPRKPALAGCAVDHLFSSREPVTSRVINYSDNGLLLELDHSLSPGDAVAVKLFPDTPVNAVHGIPVCVGMVRWCARQEGSFGALFNAGVELATRISPHVFSERP